MLRILTAFEVLVHSKDRVRTLMPARRYTSHQRVFLNVNEGYTQLTERQN